MKMTVTTLSVLLTTLIIFSACGVSKPKVQEVPLVEPWVSMNLPCKNEGVVIVANNRRFNCAYSSSARNRENEVKVITQYVEVLKQNGWKITQDISEVISVQYQLEKDDKELLLFSISSPIMTEEGERKWDGFTIQGEMATKK